MNVTQIKFHVKNVLRKASGAVSPLFSRKSDRTVSDARSVLLNCAKIPVGTASAANHLPAITHDLQIVIPAYNVEDYLEDCMESVLSQKTKYSFHVILVDDGAKDRTPEICEKYAHHELVTVIHQQNRGLSGARNTGMKALFGRYILFLDSDDLLCEGALEGMLNTAYAHDADLVEGGAYYLIDGNLSVAHQYKSDEKVVKPYEKLHGHAWGKLFKRELLADICFPEGYWYEDSLLSFLIFPAAGNIWLSSQMTTSYRINQSGIVKSSKGKPRAVETYYITEMLLEERSRRNMPMDGEFFRFMLLQIRLNQLRLADLSEEIQESAFVLTCDLLERYFPANSWVGNEKNLMKALKNRDFGMFRMCCRFF